MIVLERKDICAALLELSDDNFKAECPLNPEAIPDSSFLEIMEKHKLDPEELPLVREAYEQTLQLLEYTKWDPKAAVELLERSSKIVH